MPDNTYESRPKGHMRWYARAVEIATPAENDHRLGPCRPEWGRCAQWGARVIGRRQEAAGDSLRRMTRLTGELVVLRPATDADIAPLSMIRSAPEVTLWWGPEDDYPAAIGDDLERTFVIEVDGRVVGAVQTYEEEDPMYRHAGMDIYLDPSVHGKGIGTDAVRTMARHLTQTVGHHRL